MEEFSTAESGSCGVHPMVRIAAILLLAASTALAQGKAPPVPQPLLDARKGALEQLTAMKVEMAKLGCRGEIEDCGKLERTPAP